MNSNTTTITIDGREYDALTGMPVVEKSHERSVPHEPGRTPSSSFHSSTQRSVTLHRRSTARPVLARHEIHHSSHTHQHATPAPVSAHAPVAVQSASTVKVHHQIRKFAPHPVGAVKAAKPAQSGRMMDIGPVHHPAVVKAHAKSLEKSVQKSQPKTHIPAETIKQRAIKNAIEKTHRAPFLRRPKLPQNKLVGVLSAVVALVLFGGYLTYLNMPNLSVRVAAMQAGINADYPSYNPDGYSLNGPVTYTDGKVTLNYNANGGNQKYTINQSRSSWNSDAVLDNYVSVRAGTNYIPYTERGLVIYTYGNNAAWVNGGILYTIEGDAPLSSEQIRRIATSLL